MTNEDVAATVIGHIRQKSLGDPWCPTPSGWKRP
jgi:hypothetical protein